MISRGSIKIVLMLAIWQVIVQSVLRPSVSAQDLNAPLVLKSIARARDYLKSRQQFDGSIITRTKTYPIGTTALGLLALLNSGVSSKDRVIRDGLTYLREVPSNQLNGTYEMSLVLMVYAAAKDGSVDQLRMLQLVDKLVAAQVTSGPEPGGWGYTTPAGNGRPDRSNTQYAILALRDAAYAGIPVDRKVWKLAYQYWLNSQNPDGSWGYNQLGGTQSTGSMTVAGVASCRICQTFVKQDNLTPEGLPECCEPPEKNEAIERASRWLGREFTVRSNIKTGNFWLYYVYGLERAGRLSGRRFFGEHDWYREGVRVLLERQSRVDGSFRGSSNLEVEPEIGTSFALLFLSKGLSPVVINKLKYGPPNPQRPRETVEDLWNRHPDDARNLVDFLGTLPQWPKLLTWQTFDINAIKDETALYEILQAPIVFFHGPENPSEHLTNTQVELLREYCVQGGFLFAVNGCKSETFDTGIRQLVRRMYPTEEAALKPLPVEHPIFRSEFLLDPSTVRLEGVDVGCRTAIVYCPDDIACFWDEWTVYDVPDRKLITKSAIAKAMRIGANVVAYVTGRKPPSKLDEPEIVEDEELANRIDRGFLKLAKLKHNGDWDTAPHVVQRMLKALQTDFGLQTLAVPRKLNLEDPELARQSAVYLHGQRTFELTDAQRNRLLDFLRNGGVLLADACCGAEKFDESFRAEMSRLFPAEALEQIPVDHVIFTSQVGHELKTVLRRTRASGNPNQPIGSEIKEVEPYLEGIKIGSRYAVIYSKYDISCALENQSTLSCIGYEPKSAAQLATNMLLYSVLQDVSAPESLPAP